jgi:hypothetical protein
MIHALTQVRPGKERREGIRVFEHVVMVQPHDRDERITHHVADQVRPEFEQRACIVACGDFQREHHDRDDDGKDAVGKRAKAVKVCIRIVRIVRIFH